jgi:hypothetical protein
MELKWERWNRGGVGPELKLVTPGMVYPHGYIEVFEHERIENGKTTTWLVYNVQIRTTLSAELMDCENVDYVTLRKAMRALKETVTVLLIGGHYAV